MIRPPIIALALFLLVGRLTAAADTRPIDVGRSSLTVYAYKSGLFSVFAHDHVIRAPIADGRVSVDEPHAVEISVNTGKMVVLDPSLSEEKRSEVQTRMLGPEVLDSARHPEIRFVSSRVMPSGVNQWQVTGNLTLAGQTRAITFRGVLRDGHYRGSVLLRQRDFGIQPISIAGGTVRVKDELRIEFDIVTRAS